MHSICFHKNGSEIHSVEDWLQFAPPKEGLRQWKDGRSAKELAKIWFPKPGTPQIPAGLTTLLNSIPDLSDTKIIEGIPEHKIPLDNFRGETRNADLVLVGTNGDTNVSINIEAMADESFDQTLYQKLRSVRNPKSKIPARIDLLCDSLFGQTPESNPDLLNLRYQLLTGCAGTLIEASKVGAGVAVFVIHVFISDAVKRKKVQSNDNDYLHFMKYLTDGAIDKTDDDALIGPLLVPGGPFIPSDTALYVGKIKTEVAGVEA